MTTPSELNRRTVLKTVGAGVIGSVALTGNATAQQGRLKKELAKVRSATAEYNDPANAYADGYVVPHVSLEDVVNEAHAVCGMGFHFVNHNLIGSTEPTEPAVLAYGVDDNDDLILGAVEYLVPKEGYPTESPDLFAHDDGAEKWEEDSPYPGVCRSMRGSILPIQMVCSRRSIRESNSIPRGATVTSTRNPSRSTDLF